MREGSILKRWAAAVGAAMVVLAATVPVAAVSPIDTTTTLTAPDEAIVLDAPCFDAYVTPVPGAGHVRFDFEPPTGPVRQIDPLYIWIGDGHAQVCYTLDLVGNWTVTARYEGDLGWESSASAPATVDVARRPTATAAGGDMHQVSTKPFRVSVAVTGSGETPDGGRRHAVRHHGRREYEDRRTAHRRRARQRHRRDDVRAAGERSGDIHLPGGVLGHRQVPALIGRLRRRRGPGPHPGVRVDQWWRDDHDIAVRRCLDACHRRHCGGALQHWNAVEGVQPAGGIDAVGAGRLHLRRIGSRGHEARAGHVPGRLVQLVRSDRPRDCLRHVTAGGHDQDRRRCAGHKGSGGDAQHPGDGRGHEGDEDQVVERRLDLGDAYLRGCRAMELRAGDGSKRVFVRWRDRAGHWSAAKGDRIVLDREPPTMHGLAWSWVRGCPPPGTSESAYGGLGPTPSAALPPTASSGASTASGSGTSDGTQHASLSVVVAIGHTYRFRVRAIDGAGNRSRWLKTESIATRH